MADKQVILLTGEIQSGKTTSLLTQIKKCSGCAGILTPVENGKRYFLVIPGLTRFEMEAGADETDILEVGRFRFSSGNFERAADYLIKVLHQPAWKYIIVDEIGPLELNKRAGFWQVINKILLSGNIPVPVLVVRKKYCDDVSALFKANGFIVTITGVEDLSGVLK